jgi:hypothetical protein
VTVTVMVLESNGYGVLVRHGGVMLLESNGDDHCSWHIQRHRRGSFAVFARAFDTGANICYSDATVVLQWCYSGVTVVLQWCYSGVTVVLQWCYSGVTVVLQ